MGKDQSYASIRKEYTNSFEYIFVLQKDGKPLKSNTTYTKNNISASVNSNMPKEHKAVMKYEVAEWLVINFTDKNEIIFNPFTGYGTTALACLKNNRNFEGTEIIDKYVDMSKNRLTIE